MSYSILAQPQSGDADLPIILVSAGNDSIYSVSGDTYVAPNVTDYKFIADVYVNGVLKTTLKSFPDPQFGFGVFNLKNIAPNFVSFDFIFQIEDFDIFHNCPNSSANIYIQFGEEYTIGTSTGSTFVQNKNSVQSSTAIYINSSLSFQDYINNNQSGELANYILGVSDGLFLTEPIQFNSYIGKSFPNQRKYLYYVPGVHNDSFNGIPAYLLVNTIDSNGNLVGEYKIPVPDGLITAVQSIDVSTTSLHGSDYTVISGATDFFTNGNEASYGVAIYDSDDLNISQQVIFTIEEDCGKYADDAVTVHWLNNYGGFNSWLFNKKNETTQTKQASTYKKSYGTLNSDGTFSIKNWESSTRQYYTKLQNSININTDFLSDGDVLYLQSLFSSPVVFYENATEDFLTAITVKENSYKLNKVVNKKIYSLSLTVEPSMQDFRQAQ